MWNASCAFAVYPTALSDAVPDCQVRAAQYFGIHVKSVDGGVWLGLLDHQGECTRPTANIQYLLARLDMRLCNQCSL